LRPIIQSSLSILPYFSPNPNFSNLHCSPPWSPRRLREFLAACRSQDNPRRTVPDEVLPGAASLGFRRASCPRWLDRPVLGGSTSGFPTTARSSAFVCSTEKSVNNILPLFRLKYNSSYLSILPFESVTFSFYFALEALFLV
jgi:hypothetical protein